MTGRDSHDAVALEGRDVVGLERLAVVFEPGCKCVGAQEHREIGVLPEECLKGRRVGGVECSDHGEKSRRGPVRAPSHEDALDQRYCTALSAFTKPAP